MCLWLTEDRNARRKLLRAVEVLFWPFPDLSFFCFAAAAAVSVSQSQAEEEEEEEERLSVGWLTD